MYVNLVIEHKSMQTESYSKMDFENVLIMDAHNYNSCN